MHLGKKKMRKKNKWEKKKKAKKKLPCGESNPGHGGESAGS